MALKLNEVHHGDARLLLQELEPSSVACSVWSPPYGVGKEYEKDQTYEDWCGLLSDVIRCHFRILKPGGFLAINIADVLVFPDKAMPRIQALNVSNQRCPVTREDVLKAKRENPSFNRDQLAALLNCSEQTIDRRLNGNNIRGGKYDTQTRVHIVGGLMQDMALSSGLFPYDRRIWVKDPAWVNSQWHNQSYRSVDEFEYVYIFWKPGEFVVDRGKLNKSEWSTWGSRGVWKFRSVRSNDDHEAKFPVELPRRIIKLFTSPGDVVLDCFMGSGTTAVAALQEKRQYIGIDANAAYVALARRTINSFTKSLFDHEENGSSNVQETQLSLLEN